MDNATRYNQSLSLHRILGSRTVPARRARARPARPDEPGARRAWSTGKPPTQVLPVELWAREYEEIDVFNWQEAVSGMLSASDLEVELAASEGRIRIAVDRGLVAPDHTLTLGERTYHYFLRERAEEIRETLGSAAGRRRLDPRALPRLRRRGWTCPARTSRCCSWRCSTRSTNAAALDSMTWSRRSTRSISIDSDKGLPVERAGMRMHQADRLSQEDVRSVMLEHAVPEVRAAEVPLVRRAGPGLSSDSSPHSGASSPPRIGRRSAANASGRSPTTMSESNPDPCPFCAMPPDRIVEASEHAFVVLDAYPVSPGHSLVISRQQY